MDQNLTKITPYALKYKKNIVWNIFFNVLYAVFSTLSFVTLIPMLQVLFGEAKEISEVPVFKGVTYAVDYANDMLYYYITLYSKDNGIQSALFIVVGLVITSFLLKNIFVF